MKNAKYAATLAFTLLALSLTLPVCSLAAEESPAAEPAESQVPAVLPAFTALAPAGDCSTTEASGELFSLPYQESSSCPCSVPGRRCFCPGCSIPGNCTSGPGGFLVCLTVCPDLAPGTEEETLVVALPGDTASAPEAEAR